MDALFDNPTLEPSSGLLFFPLNRRTFGGQVVLPRFNCPPEVTLITLT